jgi:hypothetical protein
MDTTKKITLYLFLILLAPSCLADPEPVCHFDISGIQLGMPLPAVEKLVAESALVEIIRDGEASGRRVMKLYLELDDRHIVVTFKAGDRTPRVRAVAVEFLDSILAAGGQVVPNAQIREQLIRRLGPPRNKGEDRDGAFNYGHWIQGSDGVDMRYPGAGIVNCSVSLYFGRFPKGNARINLEDPGAY